VAINIALTLAILALTAMQIYLVVRH